MAKKVFEIKKPEAVALYNEIKAAIEAKNFKVETHDKGFDKKTKSYVVHNSAVEDEYHPHTKIGKVFNRKFINKLSVDLSLKYKDVENLGFVYHQDFFKNTGLSLSEILKYKFINRRVEIYEEGSDVDQFAFYYLKEYAETGDNALGACRNVDDFIHELNRAINKQYNIVSTNQIIELLEIIKEKEKIKKSE